MTHEELLTHIIHWRRDLHAIPEMGNSEWETSAYIERAVGETRPDSACTLAGTGKKFVYRCGRAGAPALAFRADMDGLPVTENSIYPYPSRHAGMMHACGHDGHMSALLALAHIAGRMRDEGRLEVDVVLLFQPAEETTGGAKDLCQSGVFEAHHVRCVFGMHLWPDLPAGVIASRKKELMSRSCEVSVTVTGKSSHIAKAEEGRDALAAGVAFYRRAVALEQSLPPEVFRLLKFGRMDSGTVRNAVSGKTLLLGSLRAFQDEVFFALRDGLVQIGQAVAEETGCQVTVHTNDGYPAVWNPEDLYDQVRACGVAFQALEKPVMISEDFSWYQRHLPGLFFFLGCGPAPALHADNFTFDEAILAKGSAFWKALAAAF